MTNGHSTNDYLNCFQELRTFINVILKSTEITKKTLQMECEEAKFALKPWTIETTVIRQLDKNVCTCDVRIFRLHKNTHWL